MTRFPLKNKLKSFFTNCFICLPWEIQTEVAGGIPRGVGGLIKAKKRLFYGSTTNHPEFGFVSVGRFQHKFQNKQIVVCQGPG